MTTQNVQKKHVHVKVFTKTQDRAAALPCSKESFAPVVIDPLDKRPHIDGYGDCRRYLDHISIVGSIPELGRVHLFVNSCWLQ
jgi:hypothetical protein